MTHKKINHSLSTISVAMLDRMSHIQCLTRLLSLLVFKRASVNITWHRALCSYAEYWRLGCVLSAKAGERTGAGNYKRPLLLPHSSRLLTSASLPVYLSRSHHHWSHVHLIRGADKRGACGLWHNS